MTPHPSPTSKTDPADPHARAYPLHDRIDRRLSRIYPDLDRAARRRIVDEVLEAAELDGDRELRLTDWLPDQNEVMLITYGDSVVEPGRSGFAALADLLDGPLGDVFSAVHVLPFFESSSDGGFSVVDYRRVAAEVGDWPELQAVVGERALMVDLVCNHGSAQSEWFTAFRRGEAPYRDWYATADVDDDLTSVVRPRTHPLLMPVDTPDGVRHVWATFSHDQVDFDFANPQVLVEFCSIIAFYMRQGATRIRLDAIAYLWKELGTACVHLPETHEVVKLMRTLMTARDPHALLITETNVPHAQNIAYFGDGDEAQVVYNFTLAPLIVWTMLGEHAGAMTGWLGRLPDPPPGCTFLNFLASHDGIGLRPIEDLVGADDLQVLLDCATEIGGAWSMYSAPGGPRPYELNVSLADLLAGSDGANRERFVAAHALMLAVQGIPAIYLHSMFSTPGDHEAVARTGHNRDINRTRLERSLIDERIESGWRAEVFAALSELIRVRRSQPAFAPTADQLVHVLHDRVVAIERRCNEQRLLAVHNVSAQAVTIELPEWAGEHDAISGATVSTSEFVLGPWQACWLTEPPG